MKGDFSRFTFNSKNRYSRVLMQQGRVQLDADWNEQLDISAYRTETEITDFIGQSGAPENPQSPDQKPAFDGDVNYQSTSFRITATETGDIAIGEGRYYVAGMLFENPDPVSFTSQPDYAGALPREPGVVYLAYLDTWQHHVTALEVPTLREIALGGADTTTRVKNIWQMKLHKLGAKGSVSQQGSDYAPEKWQPTWDDRSTGNLTVRVRQPDAILENQLYRVEIHQGNAVEGDRDPAANQTAVTFKWSRDNGSIAALIESSEGNMINLKNNGRDTQTAFPPGQLIEVSNETMTLSNQPGILAIVQLVQGDRLTVKWQPPGQSSPENLQNWTVRRWDSSTAIPIDTSAAAQPEYQLEQGITVQFESGKRYRTGDYWLIPTRALTGSIEWSPEFQPPHGIQHRYCSLALLEWTGAQYAVLADCRSIFKPITSGLLSKAGDTMRGSLTIEQNFRVMGNVGIGTTTPTSKLSVAGGVAIGSSYNDDQATSAPENGLVIEKSVAIGLSSSELAVFQANNNNTKIGNTSLFVKSKTPNGTVPPNNPRDVANTTLNATESALKLVRGGVGNWSWPNIVDFRVGRYENSGTSSRTQLDIYLAHGDLLSNAFNLDGLPDSSHQQVLTLRSNGNVGIGTTAPQAKLHLNGDLIIEQGQLIRGVPVVAFQSGSASISVSRGTGSNTQIVFNFPSDVIQAEALLKSWQLNSRNVDANQSINQIGVQANILSIEQTKVTVEVNYSWFFDPAKASSSPNAEQTGLDVTVVVIAAMNKTLG